LNLNSKDKTKKKPIGITKKNLLSKAPIALIEAILKEFSLLSFITSEFSSVVKILPPAKPTPSNGEAIKI